MASAVLEDGSCTCIMPPTLATGSCMHTPMQEPRAKLTRRPAPRRQTIAPISIMIPSWGEVIAVVSSGFMVQYRWKAAMPAQAMGDDSRSGSSNARHRACRSGASRVANRVSRICCCRLHREVDHHIAAEDHIEGAAHRPRSPMQVEVCELHQLRNSGGRSRYWRPRSRDSLQGDITIAWARRVAATACGPGTGPGAALASAWVEMSVARIAGVHRLLRPRALHQAQGDGIRVPRQWPRRRTRCADAQRGRRRWNSGAAPRCWKSSKCAGLAPPGGVVGADDVDRACAVPAISACAPAP